MSRLVQSSKHKKETSIMASYSTHKSTPAGKTATIERRQIRAAKSGNVNVKRNGK